MSTFAELQAAGIGAPVATCEGRRGCIHRLDPKRQHVFMVDVHWGAITRYAPHELNVIPFDTTAFDADRFRDYCAEVRRLSDDPRLDDTTLRWYYDRDRPPAEPVADARDTRREG